MRSKKELIEQFVETINVGDDIYQQWPKFTAKHKAAELAQIIKEENLNEAATKKFVANALRDGEFTYTGKDFPKILPPVSMLGSGRAKKKAIVIEKLTLFLERYRDI